MRILLSTLPAIAVAGVATWLHVRAADAAPTAPAPDVQPATPANAATPVAGATTTSTGAPPPAVTTRPVPLRRPATARTGPPVPGVNTPTPARTQAPTPAASRPALPIPGAAAAATPSAAPGVVTPPATFTPSPAGAAGEGGETPISPSDASAGPVDMAKIIPAGTLQLPAVAIEQVLTLYANLTARTVLRPATLPQVTISLTSQTDLTTAEAIQALDSVLALNGITMVNIGEKFVTAVPSNQALQEAPAFSTEATESLPEASQYVTKLVTLEYALPSEVAQVLQGFGKVQNGIVPLDASRTLVLRDYAGNIKRMMEIVERVDTEQEMDYTLEVIPIKYGKVDEIYGTMSSLISGGGGVGAVSTTGAGAGTSGLSSSRLGSSRGMRSSSGSSRFGGGFGGGYGNPYQSGYGGYRPQQVTSGPATSSAARTGSTTFSQRLQQIVNRAAGAEGEVELLQDARIVPDERSNSLIVFANKEDMQMITNIVAKVDQLLAQVLIEAIIMDVQLTDELEFGVSSYLRDQSGDWNNNILSNPGSLFSTVTNIASGNPSGLTWMGTYKDDLTVVVKALASTGKGQIRATPRVQTSHAMEASFSVGQTVPYVTGNFVGAGVFGGGQTFSQLDVLTELLVIPYITPDGLVVMEVSQHIEEITGFKQFDVGELPMTVTRDAQATVSVRDGDTIILGGYVRENRSRDNSGVPILKDIPLLGALFRSKKNSSSRSEMVVFIRPTVLASPQEAAAFAASERKSMKGISQLEQLMDEDQERLRNKTMLLDRKP